MKFPFGRLTSSGGSTVSDDEMCVYDGTDSEDELDDNYFWQPQPTERVHRTERYYKVCIPTY